MLNRRKSGPNDIVFDIINHFLLILLVVITLYPFLNTLAISFNDAIDSVKGGIYLWPRKFTFMNYRISLSDVNIYHSVLISALRSVIGAAANVICCLMVAYGISRKDYILRSFITRAFVFTMYFSGGLIPSYFLIKGLHLTNNFLVYIIPGLVSAFNIMVIRSYIDGLPGSLIESAKIDGASEYRILYQIIFPLCTPVLATVSLWVLVGQWNSWYDTFLYCSSDRNLSTLQYELQKVLQSSMQMSTNANQTASMHATSSRVTPMSLRAAMTIIAVVPILCVYPFLQKYFVGGLTLGGIKG